MADEAGLSLWNDPPVRFHPIQWSHGGFVREVDAVFCAAARTDIPALCATVEAQARRIEALEAIGRHGELAESYLDEREGESGGYGPGWYVTCERCNSSTYIGPDPPTAVTSMLIQHEASCVYASLTPTTDDGEEGRDECRRYL